MNRFFLSSLVTVVFLFESIIVQLLSYPLFDVYLLVPRMLLVFIVFITIFIGQTEGMTYGFIFGLLYDVAYTELLGAYAFAFSLIAYLIAKAMNVFHKNAWTASFLPLWRLHVSNGTHTPSNLLSVEQPCLSKRFYKHVFCQRCLFIQLSF